ncbi:hypothetical protein Lal_00016102 [Lupinus albus]|nr:hypothetical protein Lal_00016102 [Lupinus albus]
MGQHFLELHDNISPSLVQEFYSNFQYKYGRYVSVVKGRLIILDEELFFDIGGLASDGFPLGNCNNELWNYYDSTEMKGIWYIGLVEILKVIYGIASSLSRLLTHEIFMSRVIENVCIDTTNEEIIAVNPRDHLIRDSPIHKMSIYKNSGLWMYHEDYQITIEISDEEEDVIQAKQTQSPQTDEAPNMP